MIPEKPMDAAGTTPIGSKSPSRILGIVARKMTQIDAKTHGKAHCFIVGHEVSPWEC